MKNRILALTLAILCVLPLLAACGAAKTTGGETAEVVEEFTLPQYDFDGHEVNILSVGRGSVNTNDFLYDEKNPTVIDAAVERRNRSLESLYNVKIVTEQKNTTANQQSPEAYRVLVREATAGDTTYDFCIIPGYDVSQLAYEGYLSDLNALPNFDKRTAGTTKKRTRPLSLRTFCSLPPAISASA